MRRRAYATHKLHLVNKLSSRTMALTALVIAFAMFISSCSQPAAETTTTVTELSPGEQSDYYDSLERGSSGPLRIYWSSRRDLNPVTDQTYTGQAAYKLVYDSLLTNREDGSLTYDLADRIIWTEDGLNLIIMVKEGQYFHDGSELQAADAALSLSYLWSQNGGPSFRPDKFIANDQTDDADTKADPDDQTEPEQTDPEQDDQTEDEDSDDNDDQDNDQDESEEYIEFPQVRKADETFSLLQDIKVIDKYSFKCVFSEPAAEFAALLDYFVIPSISWQSDDPWQIIPGTGRYRISSYEDNGDLILRPVQTSEDGPESDSGPERIILKQYFDEAEAMRSLEEDKLDLVLLTPNSYALYYSRNNLDLIRFTGLSSVFLTANTESGNLSDQGMLLEVKKTLQSENLRMLNEFWPGELTDFPLPASYFMTDFSLAKISNLLGMPSQDDPTVMETQPDIQDEQDNVNETSDENASSETTDESSIADMRPQIRLVAPYEDHLISTARGIEDILDSIYNVELEILQLEDYTLALEDKDYDLVLCQTDIPEIENPSWLYGPDGSVAGMEYLMMRGINDYAKGRLDLFSFHEIWYKPNETDRIDFMDKKKNFSRLITKIAADSPYIHLYLPYAATAYGDRVKGQSDPNKYDPYKGIEELWIWSGQ